ncbi:MAG: RDD family protein [Kiritimatiellia bacterium]
MNEETIGTEPENTTIPPPETAVAQQDASMGNRIAAVLIDGLIAGACAIVPIVGGLVGMAYFLTRDALPFLDGQSLGKKALKLRAVDATTGQPLTNNWGPCIIRNIVLYIPFFFIVELIVLSNNKDGQRLGDQWAKTRVVTCQA